LKEYLYKLFNKASGKLEYLKEIELIFDIPKIETHGDLSSNAALLLTKKLKKKPREIAQEIINSLEIDPQFIGKTEIAGPGFINFFFTQGYIAGIIKDILDLPDDYGKSEKHKGKKANVEFVSANPTGPLTVGHGRNAVLGDTAANLLEWSATR
jgi:arginyl-tRNA synthetase